MTLPPFALRRNKRAPFRFHHLAKTALCFLVPPFQIEPASLGFDLVRRGMRANCIPLPSGEENSIFFGSFLPPNCKPTALDSDLGRWASKSQRLPFSRGAGAKRLRGSFPLHRIAKEP